MKKAATILLFLACLCARGAWAQGGRELVEASLQRHAQPAYAYEEQTLLLSDSLGQHTVRTLKYFSRNDDAGRRQRMIIDTPAELRGIALSFVRNAQGGGRQGPDPAGAVFGSDFTAADLEGEQPQDFTYERIDDQELDRVTHHVVKALPRDPEVARTTGYGERRLYLRKDNLFVSRIDFLDRRGRLARRETFRDARPDEAGAWRPGMILMEDLLDNRRSLLKIERRVHSADYVPDAVFAGLRNPQ